MSATSSKRDVFEHSYNEVLAALKHQDDKLNRTLTALAFLTAGGVTLYLNLEPTTAASPGMCGAQGPMCFAGEGGPSVTAVMFVVFLGSVALALLTALAAIGPGSSLRFPTSDGPRRPSLLFYTMIARDRAWDSQYEAPSEELEETLAKNFHSEAQVIARRVRYKIARSRESGAFLQLAILALSLLGIFGARGLSVDARWWIATALIICVLMLPFWEFVQMLRYKYVSRTKRVWLPYAALAASVVLTIVLLVVGKFTSDRWEALYYALFVVLLSRLALLSPIAAKVLLWPAAVPGLVLLLMAIA